MDIARQSVSAGLVMVYMPDRGVGDLMWHLPTLRAIAAATAEGRVLLAARPSSRARDLLVAEPCVEAIDYLDYRAGTFRHLVEIVDFYRLCRARRPRAVWILEKIDRPAIGAALAGVRERRGFGLGHGQERWLTHGPFLPRAMRPQGRIEKLAAFEQAHGLGELSREPDLRVPPTLADATEEAFGHLPRPWVVLGVGGFEPLRRWPFERFGELAAELVDLGGTRFWLGGFEDAEAVDAQIAAGHAGSVNVNACSLKLDAAAALMSRADLFVGNNSGPLNLAASVGCLAVGLFGSSAPLTYSRHLRQVLGDGVDMRTIEASTVSTVVRNALREA
jgi:heptosyltransferase-2